jgi:hypothetical protein
MTDPKRLSLEPESPFEAALLGSARRHPPSGAKERALVVASAAGIASTLGAAGAAAEGTAAMVVKSGSVAALKWMGVLAVAGAGAVAGTTAVAVVRGHDKGASRASLAAPPAASRPSLLTAPAPFPRLPIASPIEATPPDPIPPPEAPRTLPEPAPAAPAIAPHKSNEGRSTLPAELTLLGRAQDAMRAGDAAHALSLLDGYAARFPRGDMVEEATVMRIEALVRAGERSRAQRLADSFLARMSESAYATRVRSLLAASNP